MVIDEQQYGFVKGRNIHESIALAQEMVTDIDRKIEGGNLIIKFDMSKAYDRLEWRFLLKALKSMGFSKTFQDLIYRSICNIWYRVNVNGILSDKFRSSRGVRQGDPLSPLLFILAQQILSFNIRKLEARGSLIPYKLGRNVQSISHLFYADDMLLFTNGRKSSVKEFILLLKAYELSSGQQVNLEKSGFYPSKWVHGRRLNRLARRLGCSAKQFPLTYLGAPLFKGRCKGIYFEDLVNKFANRITGWKAKFISFAGKATLIKSTLSSLHIHTLSCLAIPKHTIARMEGIMRAFLWNQNGQHRTHWVSWERVTTSKEEGGLGIRKICDTMYGLHGKLAWNIFSGESLWARLLYQKYGLQSVHGLRPPRPNSSRLWKVLWPHFQNLQVMSQWRVGSGQI